MHPLSGYCSPRLGDFGSWFRASLDRISYPFASDGSAAANQLIPDLASPLFETEDMQGAIVSLLERGPGKAKFSGRETARWLARRRSRQGPATSG